MSMDEEQATMQATAGPQSLPRGKVRVHPFADSFPLMTDEELDNLAASIAAHGLRHPIVYDADGNLIDGRNREKAITKKLGRAVRDDEKITLPPGEDPVDYILDVNIEHRFLKSGQRALLRAKAYIQKWERTNNRTWNWEAYKAGRPEKAGTENETNDFISQRQLANDLQASQNLVKNAMLVLRYGTAKEVKAVIAGPVPFHRVLKKAVEVRDAEKKLQEAAEAEAEAAAEPEEPDTSQEQLSRIEQADSAVYEMVEDDLLDATEAETLIEALTAEPESEPPAPADAPVAAEVEVEAEVEPAAIDPNDPYEGLGRRQWESLNRVRGAIWSGIAMLKGMSNLTDEEQANKLLRTIPVVGQRTSDNLPDMERAHRVLGLWLAKLKAQSGASQ